MKYNSVRIMSLLLAITSFQLVGCLSDPPLKSGHEGQLVPSFTMLLTDSSRLCTDSIKAGAPIVFILFQTNCPSCNAETKDIIDHIRDLKDIHFYFLTMDPFADLKQFAAKYHFENFKNFTAASDYSKYFVGYFTVPAVPYIAVFGSNRRLRRVLLGRMDVGEIQKSFN